MSFVTGTGDPVPAGTPVAGLYGILTLKADGSYSYVRDPEAPGGVADVFTYRLTDGDGDSVTATLTINIADSGVRIRVPSGSDDGVTVAEAGLPGGSAPESGGAATSGSIAISAPDGLGSIRINGVEVTGVGQAIEGSFGTLTITSLSPTAIGYSYVLTTASYGDDATDSFGITVSDSDGDSANASLEIAIIDDVPTAIDDVDEGGVASSAYGMARSMLQ